MSGWAFASSPNYARSAGTLTAYPFSVMVQAFTSAVGAGGDDYLFQISEAAATGNRWSIKRTGGAATMEFQSVQSGSSVIAASSTTVTNNVPFVVVIIGTSAASRKIIVNGDLGGAGTNTTSNTPADIDRLSFGQKDDVTQGNSWVGSIFSGAVWSAALTDGEAIALAAGAWPASIRPAALRNFWPEFVNRGDGVIKDWCGRSPLTLSGGSLSTTAVRRMGPPSSNLGVYRRGQVTSRMVAA